MEPKAAFGEMRTITTLLGSVAALVLAAAFGAAVSEDPEVSVLGLRVIAAVFVVLAGSLAATWGVSRWRGQFRWWQLLWLLVFLSGLVFRIRGSDESVDSPLDLWALYRVGLIGIVALALLIRICMSRTARVTSLSQGLIGLLGLYVCVSVASSLWSIYAGWTLYKSLEYLVDVGLIAAVVASMRTTQEFKALFDWNWILIGLLLVAVYAGILIHPDLAVTHGAGLTGVIIEGILPAVSSNGVGAIGGIIGIVALARLLYPTPHRRFYLFLLLLSITTLILAQSRGAIMGFLLALAVVLVVTRRMHLVALSALVIPVVLEITGLGSVFKEFFLRGQTPEMFASLSGRVNWWQVGWDVFKEHPVIGVGAYAGARFAVLAVMGATTVPSIHNTWMEVLVGTGVLGALPMLATLVGTWIVLLRKRANERIGSAGGSLRAEALGVLASLSVFSMFSPEFVWHPPLAFLLILGYAEASRRGLVDLADPETR